MRTPVTAFLFAAALAGAAAALLPPPCALAQDYKEQFKDEVLVKGARGPSTGVEILSESWEKVEWKGKTGAAQSKPAAEIASLTYGDEPPPFTRGMDAWRSGRWSEAETEFRAVADAVKAGRCRKFWEARAAAYAGDSLRRTAAREKNPAKFLDAARSFEEAQKKDPKSPIADFVATGLADSLAGGNDWDGAFKALDDLRGASAAAGRPLWEAEARLSRARLLDRKGESAGAANEFQELAVFAGSKAGAVPPDSPARPALERMKVTGLVGRGWALYGRAEKTKAAADMDAAKTAFDRLPSETGNAPAGKAASLNGLGGLLLLEGKADEALRRFVEVEVTMFSAPEEVARALWYKALAYEKLGNKAAREQALKDLVEYYPWSDWAARAR